MTGPSLAGALAPYGMVFLLVGCLGWAVLWSLPSDSELRLRRLASVTARAGLATRWAEFTRRVSERPGQLRARRLRGTVELCRALAAELRGGGSVSTALESAVRETDPVLAAELAGAVALARSGHDPVPALFAAATRPGAAGLGYLAVCWEVAAASGSGLATVVERLAEGLTQEEALRQELTAQLAGPRATALLLSVLPVLGLLMAGALGTAPLVFLLTTSVGLGCLVGGIALNAVGLWWTRRMAARVLATVGAGVSRDRGRPDTPIPPEFRRSYHAVPKTAGDVLERAP